MTVTDDRPDRGLLHFEIEITAGAEETWRALTDPGELLRWLAREAAVRPGEGGAVVWTAEDSPASAPSLPSELRIAAWGPPRLLRLVTDEEEIEMTLHTRRGDTNVSVVHAGVGRDVIGDASAGWTFRLRVLKHYLERHRGRDRRTGGAWTRTPLSCEEAWRRLFGTDAFTLEAPRLAVGAPFALGLPSGPRLSGSLLTFLPGREISGIVRELDDGILRLSTSRAADGSTGVTVWLATYTRRGGIDGTRRRAAELLGRLFPPARAGTWHHPPTRNRNRRGAP